MVADPDGKTSPLIALAAGGIAGGVEAVCTYPLEFAKTRVQLYGHQPGSRNPFWIVGKTAREEGVRALYKGCSTMIVGSIGKDGVRFLAFDRIRTLFAGTQTPTQPPTAAQSILSGMAAGVLSSTAAVTPTERIKTALIDDARTTRRFASARACVVALRREQGLRRALYAGYVTTTLKQAGTTGLRLGSYGIVKDRERAAGIDVDAVAISFLNGAAAGTVTTLATQPFDTVKTKAQQAKAVGTLEALRQIVAEDGVWRGLWRGTVMRLGRTVLAGGVLFTANEQAVKVLHKVTGW